MKVNHDASATTTSSTCFLQSKVLSGANSVENVNPAASDSALGRWKRRKGSLPQVWHGNQVTNNRSIAKQNLIMSLLTIPSSSVRE